MGPWCALILALLFSFRYALCYSGDPVMYLPPLEVRSMRDGRQPGFVPHQQFPAIRGPAQQMQRETMPQIMHTSPAPMLPSRSSMRLEKERSDATNFTVTELLNALNRLDGKDESLEVSNKNERPELPRAAYDSYPPSYRPPPYGYQPSYGYQEQSYAPPAHHHDKKLSLLKPDLGDLVKPVTTKVAGKVSGLIGLLLALFTGSAPNDLELKGFKDIIINGIVKPLLVAKGGIKSLVSKLTIPLISILLINLEVLITIWWLWEDCSEHNEHDKPSYPYPNLSYTSSYNSYR